MFGFESFGSVSFVVGREVGSSVGVKDGFLVAPAMIVGKLEGSAVGCPVGTLVGVWLKGRVGVGVG